MTQFSKMIKLSWFKLTTRGMSLERVLVVGGETPWEIENEKSKVFSSNETCIEI